MMWKRLNPIKLDLLKQDARRATSAMGNADTRKSILIDGAYLGAIVITSVAAMIVVRIVAGGIFGETGIGDFVGYFGGAASFLMTIALWGRHESVSAKWLWASWSLVPLAGLLVANG